MRKLERWSKVVHGLEAGAGGAVAGAVIGCFAGFSAGVAGAIIGAVAGVVAVAIAKTEGASLAARDAHLDREIGVTEGLIGAPNLEHPPVSTGARYPVAPAEGHFGDQLLASEELLTSLEPGERRSWFESRHS